MTGVTRCRRIGRTVRSSTDYLIAALVLERGDALLHDDADFDAIELTLAGLRILPP